MFNLREALVIAKEEVSLDGIAQAIAYEFSKSDIEEIIGNLYIAIRRMEK